jgi:hypothetical protein
MNRENAPPWAMIAIAIASITCSVLMIRIVYGLVVAAWHWARAQ